MAHRGRLPSRCPEVDTLLLDLDRTLVDMRDRAGLQLGFMALAVRRYAPAVSAWRFPVAFWAAMRAMQRHGTTRTNHEAFVDSLCRSASCSREQLETLNE